MSGAGALPSWLDPKTTPKQASAPSPAAAAFEPCSIDHPSNELPPSLVAKGASELHPAFGGGGGAAAQALPWRRDVNLVTPEASKMQADPSMLVPVQHPAREARVTVPPKAEMEFGSLARKRHQLGSIEAA
eukprot:s2939_g7.t1